MPSPERAPIITAAAAEGSGRNRAEKREPKDLITARDSWGRTDGIYITEPLTPEDSGEWGGLYEDEMLLPAGRITTDWDQESYIKLIDESIELKREGREQESREKQNQAREVVTRWVVKKQIASREEWGRLSSESQKKFIIDFLTYNQPADFRPEHPVIIDRGITKNWLSRLQSELGEKLGERAENLKFYISTHTPLDVISGTDFFLIYKGAVFPFDLTQNMEKLNNSVREGKGLPLFIEGKNNPADIALIAEKIAKAIEASPVLKLKIEKDKKGRRELRRFARRR